MGDSRRPCDPRMCHWIGVQTRNRADAKTPPSYLHEKLLLAKPPTLASSAAGARRPARSAEAWEPYQWEKVSYSGVDYPLCSGTASYLFTDAAATVVVLLFDLGARAPAGKPGVGLARTAAKSTSPILVLRSCGHTSTTFSCLADRNCETPCNSFFDV
jgi:hypothetical protein